LHTRTLSEPGIDSALSAQLGGPERVHAILRFEDALSAERHAELRAAGVELLDYLRGHAYTASLPGSAVLGSGVLGGLFGADALRPEDKLDPALRAREPPAWAVHPESGRVRVLVEFFSDVKPSQAARLFETHRVPAEPYGPTTWRAELDLAVVRALAGADIVARIVPGPIPVRPLDEAARGRTETDAAQQGTFYWPRPIFRVDASPVGIGICDLGIDAHHHDFDDVTVGGTAGSSRVKPQSTTTPTDPHGTLVASIAAGSGLNSDAEDLPAFQNRGHAPFARIGDYPPLLSQVAGYRAALVDDGMDVTNHSYVQSWTVYDNVAADLDRIVPGGTQPDGTVLPAAPQVWAAGNSGESPEDILSGGDEEGYYAVATSAKNTVSVGSVYAFDGHLSSSSSLGPTFDGRIKPDLLAPGCRSSVGGLGIRGAMLGGQAYTGMCGTSMAAPAVTGIVALLMHQLSGAFPTLRPSTYKALLVQTAHDAVKIAPYATAEWKNPDTGTAVLFHAGPDFATGWGEVDAEAARELAASDAQWNEDDLAAVGSKDVWWVDLPQGAAELKATLAWDDLPGSTLLAETEPRLVNDLDLKLVRPGGADVLPWTLTPLPPPANPGLGAKDAISQADVKPSYRGLDRLNNVELASEPRPVAGCWQVVVTAGALPMGKSQRYSIAASEPLVSPKPSTCP
jgi:subtilisin family serine protease